jgi:Fe-S-cluster containining protein
MALITDLEDVKRLAEARHDEFEVMRYLLELNDELDDAAFDALVDEVAAPVIAAIDCTQCANCCRSLEVAVTEADAARLASGIDVPLDAIATIYVDREAGQAVEEWGVMRGRPCPFLNGKLCSVYAHRPDACRIFPDFTPDFRWTLSHTIENASICPIIYNVLSELAAKVDSL